MTGDQSIPDKIQKTLGEFAGCGHDRLTCDSCGASATWLTWSMSLIAERDSLAAENAELRAAIVAMRELWPIERWGTLAGICRKNPCVDKAARAAGEKHG